MPDDATLSRLLEAFQAKRDLRNALAGLADALAREPPTTATRHVLGFMHIRLGEVDGHALRLHLWPYPLWPLADPPWPVHTHAWKVESFVVVGAVENLLYSVDANARGRGRLYRVEYGGTESRRVATQQVVDCTFQSRERFTAGSYYEIPEGQFHTTRTVDAFATTLVVTGPPQPAPPLVMGDADGDPVYRYTTRVVSPEQAQELLARLSSELG
jgi:hypothetical protein